MSTDSPNQPRSLPERPNLRHLKEQAKDLLKSGGAESLTEAQFKIARLYGFASWPKLKAHVDSLAEVGQLKQAIDTNDVERVKSLMTRNPTLHRAPLGYGRNGPLTWVAECRVPWSPPSAQRLAMAEWMIDHGSDVHQLHFHPWLYDSKAFNSPDPSETLQGRCKFRVFPVHSLETHSRT